ncbi:MAG TPA: tail fiber protein [Thermoanaerobaculia bacterium]
MGLGEIRLFAGKNAPRGWSLCDGTRLKIQDHRGLYDVLGASYGADSAMFALPDLRNRVPIRGTAGAKEILRVRSARPNTPHGRIALNFIIALNERDIPDTGPFLGEIRSFAFAHPTPGWAYCDGQTLRIARNDALFDLIEWTFGGDRSETFGMPDLRGAYPVHPKTPQDFAKTGGAQASDERSSNPNLLSLNYCIATVGMYPR